MAGPLNTILPDSLPTTTPSAPSLPNPTTPSTPSLPNPSADQPQPPRPPNSWILYRRWKIDQLPPVAPGEPRRTQGEVSTLISALWNSESEFVRTWFERQADLKKREHLRRYPHYKYKPQRREDKAKGKRRASPKGSTKKQEARSSRGVSAGPSNSVTPQPQPAGHPYLRPLRVLDDAIRPSPPVSAACSPSTSLIALPPADLFVSGSLVSDAPTPQQPFYPQTSANEMPPWPTMQFSVPAWEPPADSNALYFDLPREHPVEWPALNNFSCQHLDDQEHDFSCFLNDIPSMPTGNQTTDLEVSVGSGLMPLSAGALGIQAFFTQEPGFSSNLDYGLFQADDSNFAIPPNSLVNDFAQVCGVGSEISTPSTSVIPTDVASYVPPAGASQSSTRRVAADWTQYVQTLDGSPSYTGFSA